ncbi:hypothetical protein [Rhodoferax sp.]|uniref:hypothetical protein n=1 Tax=Rhodoferax sp. TaxID=50421 RepID=UPI00275B8F69|nr:hypothetical protein [Rhodoferax sp.]
MNPQERYQVLTDDFMVRLSDGAVLHVSATDDLRGPQAFEQSCRLTPDYSAA